MSYKVVILRRAQKELAGLFGDDFERVKVVLLSLADNPRPHGCLKLSGRDGWRVRIGNHRVIYKIDLLRKWEVGGCPSPAFAEQSEYEQTHLIGKTVLLQEV